MISLRRDGQSVPTLEESVDLIRRQLETGELRFALSPERWATCQLPTPLKWNRIHFSNLNAKKVPTKKGGVYCFVLRPSFSGPPETSYLLYIGQTTQFRTRYRRYLTDRDAGYKRRPHVYLMLNKWPDDLWFCYAPVTDLDQLDTFENSLMDSCVPPFNIDFTGTVNPAVRMWRILGPFR